jgi:hypothetical protein
MDGSKLKTPIYVPSKKEFDCKNYQIEEYGDNKIYNGFVDFMTDKPSESLNSSNIKEICVDEAVKEVVEG